MVPDNAGGTGNEMVETDHEEARKEAMHKHEGFKVFEDANDPDLWFRQDRYIWCIGDGWQPFSGRCISAVIDRC